MEKQAKHNSVFAEKHILSHDTMKQKDILYLLIPACLLIFAWIAFNIYHNVINSTIPETTNMQIEPITPRFDTSVIDGLKQRQSTIPVFELSKNSSESASKNIEILTPIPTSTQSATTPSPNETTP